jgi:methylenetetrahydrofolate dehydrogenase (NADP+)/methenyltetrahydrofolate cyclohydrolase
MSGAGWPTHVARLKADRGITPGLAVVLVGSGSGKRGLCPQQAAPDRRSRGWPLSSTVCPRRHGRGRAARADRPAECRPGGAWHPLPVPLPGHLNADAVINAIDPEKDVDGFHISNVGLLATGQKALVPCTPLGCLMLLRDRLGSLSGADAVVIGRSNIVGKPMAQLLLRDSCTVTVAHSRTKIWPRSAAAPTSCRRGGPAEMVPGDWIKPGATVIDVGINRLPAPEKRGGQDAARRRCGFRRRGELRAPSPRCRGVSGR